MDADNLSLISSMLEQDVELREVTPISGNFQIAP